MRFGAVDYAASYFKYKTPTPIHGAPTNKTLKRLKQELRANASSVESDLGGGDHGYLGLVLTDIEYAIVCVAIAFSAPVFPITPLVIPIGTDQVQALNLREQYKDAKLAYYECKNVEKALQRHIQDAIEDKYLESLVNEDTQLIDADIPTVLTYLFDNYGKVPSEEVKQKETEIRTMQFNPADPMILLFNPIEKLAKMGISAEIEYTEKQLLDIGLTVIRNTRDFEKALGEWEALATIAKTWITFKSHFKNAQQQLKAIRGPTMQQAGYHHANHLAQTMRSDNNRRDEELMSMLSAAVENNSHAPSMAESDDSTLLTQPSYQHQANAVQSDPVQLEMLKLLQQIQSSMLTPQPAPPLTPQGGKGGHRGGGNRAPRKTRDDATYPRKITDKYCWTHGGGSHISAVCNSKCTGHQDGATFANRMGGSKAYCPT